MTLRRIPVLLLPLATACGNPDADGKSSAEPPVDDSGLVEPDTCADTTAPPRALRLLTRREYAHTVDDLFAWLDGDDATTCSTHLDCTVSSQSCLGGECRPDPCDTLTVVIDSSIAGASSSVVVAGAFNDWAATAEAGGWPLSWSDDLGAHWGKFTVDEGTWSYKVVVDGTDWMADPGASDFEDDGFGGQNSLAHIDCSGSTSDGGALVADVDPLADFPAESRPQHHPFDNAVESGLVTTTRASAFLDAAEVLATRVVDQRARVVPCSVDTSVSAERACWTDFIGSVGLRTWRRPLTDSEVGRLVGLMELEDSPADGLSLALQVLLSSPHFLYRTELGVLQDDGTYRLTAYETASLLSYTLWGTGPDSALLDAAASGSLDTAEGIAAQAGRLLDDPRAGTRFGSFATAWLGVDAVPTMSRNPDLYPGFTSELGQAMVDEVAERAATIALDGDGGLRALLTGTHTTVTPELAALYGIDAPGSGWSAATVPADRPGLLGTPAWLTATSHSDQTSPVRRGLFVRERILCQDLGTPPADAGGVPDVDPDASTRDRFAQHSDDPACSGCHQYIDPVGFGFEHLDSIGQWRVQDGAHPVDASGDVLGIDGIGGTDSHPFYGLGELAPLLADSSAASHCFVEMSWRHATGQGPETAHCAIEQLQDRFDADRPVRDLLLTLVATDAFVHRSEPGEAR